MSCRSSGGRRAGAGGIERAAGTRPQLSFPLSVEFNERTHLTERSKKALCRLIRGNRRHAPLQGRPGLRFTVELGGQTIAGEPGRARLGLSGPVIDTVVGQIAIIGGGDVHRGVRAPSEMPWAPSERPRQTATPRGDRVPARGTALARQRPIHRNGS